MKKIRTATRTQSRNVSSVISPPHLQPIAPRLLRALFLLAIAHRTIGYFPGYNTRIAANNALGCTNTTDGFTVFSLNHASHFTADRSTTTLPPPPSITPSTHPTTPSLSTPRSPVTCLTQALRIRRRPTYTALEVHTRTPTIARRLSPIVDPPLLKARPTQQANPILNRRPKPDTCHLPTMPTQSSVHTHSLPHLPAGVKQSTVIIG